MKNGKSELLRLIIFVVIILVCLFGCSSNHRMECVNEEFPNCEVAYTPSNSSDFLVRKQDGSVWYVRCDNPFSGKITSKSMILPPNKTDK